MYMKKPLIAVIGVAGVLIGALLLAPYWLGMKGEQVFAERLQALADQGGMQVARNDYERGWFSSHAQTLLRVPGLPVEISARHAIHHGPFTVGRWFEGEFDAAPKQAHIDTHGELTLSAADAAAASALPFTVNTVIDLDGTAHAHLSSPALSHATPAGKLEWRGLEGDIHFDATARWVRSEVRAPGLTLAAVEVNRIAFRSDLREGVAGHYLGKTTLDVSDIAVAPLFRAQRLKVAGDSSAQGETLNLRIAYEAPDVQIAGQQHGPTRLVVEARKLDAAVLARFQDELRALQGGDRPAEQLGLMQMGKLLQLVGELSKKAPEIEITDLGFRVGGEEVRGKAKLVLDGSKSNIAENPLLMLTALAGDVDVSLPVALVKPMLLPLLQADLEDYRRRGLLKKTEAEQLTPQHLSAILDRAYPMYLARNEFTRRFDVDGNRLRLGATLRRGQITVNGEPFSLPGIGMIPALQ
jgi:uncharacterized protein YdgA (DUF945 family)